MECGICCGQEGYELIWLFFVELEVWFYWFIINFLGNKVIWFFCQVFVVMYDLVFVEFGGILGIESVVFVGMCDVMGNLGYLWMSFGEMLFLCLLN